MKKFELIVASTLVCILLFYNQFFGLNLALYGLVLLGFIISKHPRFWQKDQLAAILVVTSVLSALAFAWYGDFLSFLALFSSLVLLQFRLERPDLAMSLSFPTTILSAMSTWLRIFLFDEYLPKQKLTHNWIKKVVAFVVIPALLLGVFVAIYAFSSDLISDLFLGYEWDVNIFQLIFVTVLGFYFSFSYWNFWTPDYLVGLNDRLKDDFTTEATDSSFLGIEFERRSGEISLFLLNALLVVFIGSYTYEQFFQLDTQGSLSAETHERINSVIVSMILAIGVVLYFFRARLSFDVLGKRLQNLAQVWIILNVFLMFTALLKNAEYVLEFGLTYKRLGVFAFLILVFFGLLYSFFKIKYQKTNLYLIKRMFWYFYALILVCSFVNWGGIITRYNIAVGKGVEVNYLNRLHFNEIPKNEYFSSNGIQTVESNGQSCYRIQSKETPSFLSKILYYEFIK